MNKLTSIIDGWRHLLWRDPAVEEVALTRAKICSTCPKLNSANVCTECSCYIPAKVRSLGETCKIGKW